jgi:hypothetical protein
MGRLRIVVTGLLALAFALGPGWTPCIALPQGHAASIASHDDVSHDEMTSHRSHSHHSHMAAADDHASAASHAAIPAKDRESGHEDACLKCCAACIPTSILPRSEMVWAPAGSRVVFAALIARAPGRVVFVDPDIPKHVA